MEKFTIVLADDDEDEYLFFNDALSSLHRNVALITCENGEKLLHLLQRSLSVPDVIFLDINMPYLNGFETLQKLKSDERFRAIPVVMYSTSTNSQDMKKAFSYGANLYLCKVIAMRDLPGKLDLIIDGIQNNKPFQIQQFVFTAF